MASEKYLIEHCIEVAKRYDELCALRKLYEIKVRLLQSEREITEEELFWEVLDKEIKFEVNYEILEMMKKLPTR